MEEATLSYERDDWAALTAAFEQFFAGAGTVTIDADLVTFDGGDAGTRFELRRDGSTSASMPLHGLEAHWERVRFDRVADEVVVEAGGFSYSYRVPPPLRA